MLSRGSFYVDPLPSCSASGPRGLDGLLDRLSEHDARRPQLDAVVRDAADVEQVVDRHARADRAGAPSSPQPARRCRGCRASGPRACCGSAPRGCGARVRGRQGILATIRFEKIGGELPHVVVEPLAPGLGALAARRCRRAIFDAPTTSPASSLIGDTVSDTRTEAGCRLRAPPHASRNGPRAGPPSGSRLIALLLGEPLRRDHERDMAGRSACSAAVAERPLGRGVPALDDAVERLC